MPPASACERLRISGFNAEGGRTRRYRTILDAHARSKPDSTRNNSINTKAQRHQGYY
jgi:hypothetical protein